MGGYIGASVSASFLFLVAVFNSYVRCPVIAFFLAIVIT